MKEIARFSDLDEAHIAAGYLRAQGFEVVLPDLATMGVYPSLGVTLSGYRLMVEDAQAHMATVELEKVRNFPHRGQTVTGFHCEACGSAAMRRIRNPMHSVLALLLGFVITFAPATKNLRCTACGHRQPAEPDEEEA